MSGFVGIWNTDGAPVDRALLGRMNDSIAFRGPDEQRIWLDDKTGSIGFGHTLLRTTPEAKSERQPFSLDGEVWITGDVRVDARDDLIAELKREGGIHQRVERRLPDVELILHAYHAWGRHCVDHLLGDFAFAIWDRPRQTLFCARDQLGVKPFFFAHVGRTLIVSNTIDCIRKHPLVSGTLNDLAIADFLLFDVNTNLATTSFIDIQRIPPAHVASWSPSTRTIARYWTPPVDEPVYYKRAADYTDRFRELLGQAVGDRLRTESVGIFMSGGLDSTALAATASESLRTSSARPQVHAFTSLVDRVADGEEQGFVELVARALDIPVHYRDERGLVFTPDWFQSARRTPEPITSPEGLDADWQEYRQISRHTRVLFFGEGPDNLLKFEWRPHISQLVKARRLGRLAKDAAGYVAQHRRIPLPGSFVRAVQVSRRSQTWWHDTYPRWINKDLESRYQLRTRWEEYHRSTPTPAHPWRPSAFRSLTGPLWERFASRCDPALTRAAVDVRHPFLDLRLVRYMLQVPTVPWCRSKHLLRTAMAGRLPEAVLRRPKASLNHNGEWISARACGLPKILPADGFDSYVEADLLPREASDESDVFWTDARAWGLNYWLRNRQRVTNSV